MRVGVQVRPIASPYYDLKCAAEVVKDGQHRAWVGGLWEEIGQLQFDFLVNRGLRPDMRLLDVGCGCLRGGVHFVRYLNSGNYYGIDISQELMNAGRDRELGPLGLKEKLPLQNLSCRSDFHAGHFGVQFDIAIAQSLFTHLPINHIRLCIARLAEVVRLGGTLYATIFWCSPDQDWSEPIFHPRGGITSHPADDPYHYRTRDIVDCAAELPWDVEMIGDWGHPRDQVMVALRRTR